MNWVLPGLVALAWVAPARAALTVAAEENALVASGATVGGQVAWLAVLRTDQRYHAELEIQRELLTDDDNDGTVRLPLPAGVPWKSVWVAVDVTSGSTALGFPDEFEVSSQPLPLGSLLRDGAGDLDLLHFVSNYAEWLIVRPGAGAWSAAVRDDGNADTDGGLPGESLVPLADFTAVAGSATPPAALASGDRIVVIEPETFTVSLHQVLELEP